MANKLTLQHKRNSISGTAPNAADIAVGEIAINLADKKLFTKDSTNAIVELGGGSNWVTEPNGISRADKIKVGAASDPLVAIDVDGTVGQNVQTSNAVNASTGQIWMIDAATPTSVTITGTVPQSTTLVLVIDGPGPVTWPASVKWSAGTAPTLTGIDNVFTLFTADAGITWYGNSFITDAQ